MKDIRQDNPRGFQPAKVDTTTLIKMYGWQTFELIDLPVASLEGISPESDEAIAYALQYGMEWLDQETMRVRGTRQDA